MSLSQKALILIRLDGRPSEVVTVADLAAHMGLSVDVVRQQVQELAEENWVQAQWDWADGAAVLSGAMAIRRVSKFA